MKHQPPNIVFIVLDTHRADRLGCYGYSQNTSPNIDEFARQATQFENAISPAQWTIPAHASMFSGEYPSTHRLIQSAHALPQAFPTMAEYLQIEGYQNTGFCNNPLVGVLDNGLRRGFEAFYNYGGTVPSTPGDNGHGEKSLNLLASLRQGYRSLINRIATPIQQAVASSSEIFQAILNPKLVSLWTRYANFKGDTAASIHDVTAFIRREFTPNSPPQFVFLNLMETHLPYTPPERFVRAFAPIIQAEPAARAFMQAYNTQAIRWLLPLAEPYPEIEAQTLHQMYDAEVAYQDDLLHPLLRLLAQPQHQENTLVVMVADHGEMLGEHLYMGHGLGLHQELVHVPLLIRFPGQGAGRRVPQVVSTAQLFDTVLAAAGLHPPDTRPAERAETRSRNLGPNSPFYEQQPPPVFSEAFPPDNIIQIMRKHEPALLQACHCEQTQRAAYQVPWKLVRIENVQEQIFNLTADRQEKHPIPPDERHQTLTDALGRHLAEAIQHQTDETNQPATAIEDEAVLERLRGLGYIE